MADRGLARGGGRDRAAGLMRGTSGQALLFLRLYERTCDPAYLDLAEAAIAADLDRCVTDHEGLTAGRRRLAEVALPQRRQRGIGMVIDRFLPHRHNSAFAEAAAAIRIGAQSAYFAQSGLFNGRAGMIIYLAGHDGRDRHACAHIRRLAWHAVRYEGGLAFPGDMLFRLSMDLGTGTAGVLLAVAAALAPQGAALPFLGPPEKPPWWAFTGSRESTSDERR